MGTSARKVHPWHPVDTKHPHGVERDEYTTAAVAQEPMSKTIAVSTTGSTIAAATA